MYPPSVPYEKFAVACGLKREDLAEDSQDFIKDLSNNQLAAFAFWRIMGVYIDDDGETQSIHDEGIDTNDEDEDTTEKILCAFAGWIKEFERDELPELIMEGSLSTTADALMGVHHIGFEIEGQTFVKTIDTNAQKEIELPPLTPLSDKEIDEILRKRRGYGIRK